MTETSETLRRQLIELLDGGHAHAGLKQIVADYPFELANRTIPGLPYTVWHLLEHLRIAQWDILEFIRNPQHVSPEWPAGYWPPRDKQADRAQWQETVEKVQADTQALLATVQNPETDLYADLPHAPGYSVLREILVVCDHNAYHLGELSALKDVMSQG